MATLTICINKQRLRTDGTNQVYIRVMHAGNAAYIKTNKVVSIKGLTKDYKVKDPLVIRELSPVLVEYMDRLNRVDISRWTVNDVADYLRKMDEDLCFSDYARKHIDKMIDNGQQRNAKNYKLALQSMELYFGTNKIMFSFLTSVNVGNWIESLSKTARAKEMYPVCMRQVFKAAVSEMNDYDTGLIRIKTNPWIKVKIPAADRPEKKAISAEACRAFFSAPLPESKMVNPLPELGRDVAMIVLCLAGINTVDLYNMRKSDYYGGILHYRRAKVMRARTDGAYIEMRVPQVIHALFDKYRTCDEDDYLFNFHSRYCDSDSFCANVNNGIKLMCRSMGMRKEDYYCVYTFRHTWATTAQNDCGASLSEVGFAMNHTRGQSVTRGYVRLDFSPAWELNEKVVDFIFFSDAPSKSAGAKDDGAGKFFRLSPKMMIRAAAFYGGRCLASFEDIGYSTIDEVTKALVSKFPDDIPMRAVVQFKIVNLDNEKVTAYEHMKGKGF